MSSLSASDTVLSSADELKIHLAGRLPEMLSLALEAYDTITGQPASEDPRAFTAQQGGAKAALTHMEALLKLAQSVMLQPDVIGQSVENDDELSLMLKRAKQAVGESQALPEEGDEIGGEV
ncbi:hypothetical protein [Curvivirga aplysinae]|uniref:hypothetical protein n=1 Tax=Curvivirga aplysinae TaxID=2529852 RepID=UPI0012BC3F9B|nr:hypothetical protein [Curvivirga aplysinae]MTI10272.1 hypothetical protein [Curvivirga aplysinae]